jgi:hypothetical protein
MDLCAHILIEISSKDDLRVKIDKISVKQHLLCLLHQGKWLDDDVSLLMIIQFFPLLILILIYFKLFVGDQCLYILHKRSSTSAKFG